MLMPKMSAGVMSMVANAASTLQRKAEAGEVRNADVEAVPYLVMETGALDRRAHGSRSSAFWGDHSSHSILSGGRCKGG